MLESFIDWRPQAHSEMLLARVEKAVAALGIDATLRQVYWYLVDLEHIEESRNSYDRLQTLVNTAHLAGALDWQAVADHTPRVFGEHGAGIEVWVEKANLVDQVVAATHGSGVTVVSCQGGFPPTSTIYDATTRGARTVFVLADRDDQGDALIEDLTNRFAILSRIGEEVVVNDIGWAETHDDETAELETVRPEHLARFVRDALRGYGVTFTGAPSPLDPRTDALLAALDEVGDTTRAVALKKKIRAILDK